MRRLTRILPLAVLLLPGCVLAIGGDSDGHRRGPQPLEQRVADLERRVHDMEQCMASCCKGGMGGMNMHEDGEEGEEHEGHEGHAPPPPPPGGPH